MPYFLQMFADLHHLHQFISLDQGGSVTAESWAGGTHSGEANIYFGELLSRIVAHLAVKVKCYVL